MCDENFMHVLGFRLWLQNCVSNSGRVAPQGLERSSVQYCCSSYYCLYVWERTFGYVPIWIALSVLATT
jgi:hypothetical protein